MKSFLSGRTQVSGASLQPMAASISKDSVGGISHLHSKEATAAGATVQCIKQGDQIVRLIVTCTCGEKIEIDCVYPV